MQVLSGTEEITDAESSGTRTVPQGLAADSLGMPCVHSCACLPMETILCYPIFVSV